MEARGKEVVRFLGQGNLGLGAFSNKDSLMCILRGVLKPVFSNGLNELLTR